MMSHVSIICYRVFFGLIEKNRGNILYDWDYPIGKIKRQDVYFWRYNRVQCRAERSCVRFKIKTVSSRTSALCLECRSYPERRFLRNWNKSNI
jgi:hypothetical protein